jgi:hypothetical protein
MMKPHIPTPAERIEYMATKYARYVADNRHDKAIKIGREIAELLKKQEPQLIQTKLY